MSQQILPEDETALAQRLRGEAHASRPEFSEQLHARICAAIRMHRPRSQAPRKTSLTLRRWACAAATAACAAGVVLAAGRAFWRADPRHDLTDRAVAAVEPSAPPDLEALASGTAQRWGALVDAAWTTSQWAYLDHDARLAANLLLDQLPLELAASKEP
jgi:hypothetical protein